MHIIDFSATHGKKISIACYPYVPNTPIELGINIGVTLAVKPYCFEKFDFGTTIGTDEALLDTNYEQLRELVGTNIVKLYSDSVHFKSKNSIVLTTPEEVVLPCTVDRGTLQKWEYSRALVLPLPNMESLRITVEVRFWGKNPTMVYTWLNSTVEREYARVCSAIDKRTNSFKFYEWIPVQYA